MKFTLSHQRLRDTEGNPASWIQMFKPGDFEHVMGPFSVDDEFMAELMENFETQKEKSKDKNHVVPIDYNHDRTIAAGWIQDMEIRSDGLYAKVEWTPKAADHIKNSEFKFISPEFSLGEDHVTDEHGEEIEGSFLWGAALTNRPFLKNMESVKLSRSEKQGAQRTSGGSEMKDKLLKIFNLKEGDDAVLVKLVESSQASAKLLSDIGAAIGETEAQKIVDGVKKLADDKGDLSRKLSESVERITRLETEGKTIKAESAVKEAIRSGKLAPAQKEWARSLFLTDETSFSKFVETAPKIVDTRVLGSSGDDTDSPGGDPIKELNEMIGKEIEANPKLSYELAMSKVKKSNPDLIRRYAGATKRRA